MPGTERNRGELNCLNMLNTCLNGMQILSQLITEHKRRTDKVNKGTQNIISVEHS